MRERDLLLRTILVLDQERQVLAGLERLEPEDVDLVRREDLVVVLGVREREGKHALLFQVRLVDARERAGDDREPTEEARLERGVFARGAFAVVGVADDDPLDALRAVFSCDLRDAVVFARELVLDLVGLAVLDVDGADETVLGDVLEMSAVLEPGTASRDVVRS